MDRKKLISLGVVGMDIFLAIILICSLRNPSTDPENDEENPDEDSTTAATTAEQIKSTPPQGK